MGFMVFVVSASVVLARRQGSAAVGLWLVRTSNVTLLPGLLAVLLTILAEIAHFTFNVPFRFMLGLVLFWVPFLRH
jgi:hypothetical protein